MRIPALVLTACAAAVVSWSGVAVASAAPPKCTDIGGFVDAANLCQIQATDPGYSLSIVYPVRYPDYQPVYDWVRQTRDGFLNVAKMPDSRGMPYQLDTTATEYSSAVPPRGTQSVVFKTFSDVGGAHPQTFYKSFNWDQGLRKPITIDTLFRPETQPFQVLFPLVKAELEKQSGQPVPLGPEAGLEPATYENFAITDDTLIFFFGQGVLLPEAAGALQVTVPRASVDAMIA